MLIVEVLTSDVPPSPSVTRSETLKIEPIARPVARPVALKVGVAPVSLPRVAAAPVSPNVPSSSRSHANDVIVSGPGSLPLPARVVVVPDASLMSGANPDYSRHRGTGF